VNHRVYKLPSNISRRRLTSRCATAHLQRTSSDTNVYTPGDACLRRRHPESHVAPLALCAGRCDLWNPWKTMGGEVGPPPDLNYDAYAVFSSASLGSLRLKSPASPLRGSGLHQARKSPRHAARRLWPSVTPPSGGLRLCRCPRRHRRAPTAAASRKLQTGWSPGSPLSGPSSAPGMR